MFSSIVSKVRKAYSYSKGGMITVYEKRFRRYLKESLEDAEQYDVSHSTLKSLLNYNKSVFRSYTDKMLQHRLGLKEYDIKELETDLRDNLYNDEYEANDDIDLSETKYSQTGGAIQALKHGFSNAITSYDNYADEFDYAEYNKTEYVQESLDRIINELCYGAICYGACNQFVQSLKSVGLESHICTKIQDLLSMQQDL